MELLKIDGSYGEGGGQILRSTVALSCITKKPIQIDNIRKNRKVPGLRAQHLTVIKLLAKIFDARVEGLRIGSTSIKFFPSEIIPSMTTIREDVGTAGSIPLIVQVLVPVVSLSKGSLKISIRGGTDVPWSPTGNYTKYVMAQAYSRMGIKFSMNVKKRGYYPKGGGMIELEIKPAENAQPISLLKRKTKSAVLMCSFSRMSFDKLNEQISKSNQLLKEMGFSVKSEIREESALNQGGSVLIFSTDSQSIIGSDCLINPKSGALFGKLVLKNFIECDLGADVHLSDMLVLPACLIDKMSIFRVREITKHLETNLYVTSKITGSKYIIDKLDGGFEVRITGRKSKACIK